jgi:hypothetical protein
MVKIGWDWTIRSEAPKHEIDPQRPEERSRTTNKRWQPIALTYSSAWAKTSSKVKSLTTCEQHVNQDTTPQAIGEAQAADVSPTLLSG